MFEYIETEYEYIELTKHSKNPNFEAEIGKLDIIPKDPKITKALKIIYHPNGQVDLYENYDEAKKEFHIEVDLTFDYLKNARKNDFYGITKGKVKDMQALLPFVSPRAETYILSKKCRKFSFMSSID